MKKSQKKSKFDTFVLGMTSIFTLYPDINMEESVDEGLKSDTQNLRGDFIAIGNDLRASITKIREELNYEQELLETR